MASKGKSVAPALVACAILLIPMSAYFGCYVWLSTPCYGFHGGKTPFLQRSYPYWRMAQLFQPAAEIESLAIGIEVSTAENE
jgi:hypothetical protein